MTRGINTVAIMKSMTDARRKPGVELGSGRTAALGRSARPTRWNNDDMATVSAA